MALWDEIEQRAIEEKTTQTTQKRRDTKQRPHSGFLTYDTANGSWFGEEDDLFDIFEDDDVWSPVPPPPAPTRKASRVSNKNVFLKRDANGNFQRFDSSGKPLP